MHVDLNKLILRFIGLHKRSITAKSIYKERNMFVELELLYNDTLLSYHNYDIVALAHQQRNR